MYSSISVFRLSDLVPKIAEHQNQQPLRPLRPVSSGRPDHFRHISNADAQTGNTCVEVIMFSLPPNAATRAGAISLVPSLLHLQSRLHDPAFSDPVLYQHAEDGVVNNRITDTDDRERHSLLLLPDRTMKSIRPCENTYRHASPEEYRLGMPGLPESVDDVQDRRNEHEGELDRLGVPVRNEVSAAEIIIPPTFARFLV